MLWEGNSTPEWVDGAGLANSDAVSTEMLSAFLDTLQVKWLSKEVANSIAAEQAAQGLSAGNADSVEGAGGESTLSITLRWILAIRSRLMRELLVGLLVVLVGVLVKRRVGWRRRSCVMGIILRW